MLGGRIGTVHAGEGRAERQGDDAEEDRDERRGWRQVRIRIGNR